MMQRRPYAALLALTCGVEAPRDLTQEIVRATLHAETERFQARLRQIDAERLNSVICWYYKCAQAPLRRLRSYPSSVRAQHWLELIERCDEELCSALVQLAALPSARDYLLQDVSLRDYVDSHPHDRYAGVDSTMREILHPDILEYIGCARLIN